MLTDTQTLNMRNVLHQIYVSLYVEFGKLVLCFEWPLVLMNGSCQEPPIAGRTSRR
jgi:hypothetical protein